jgi:D-lyxose ketol-isomerase
MVCVDLVGPFTIRTPAKTYSLIAIKMIDPVTGWFEIVKATNKSATSIQDSLHNFSTMGRQANSNVSSNKCVCKTIMALKPNQLQVTTYHPQANAIIERIHKGLCCQLYAQII